MDTPLRITFHQMPPSPALEADVRTRVEELQRLCHRIVSCRVFVDLPHRHHAQGRHYRVRVEIAVPGAQLVAGHSGEADASHEDAYVAVGDAFRAARRQLESYADREHEVRRPLTP
jgi:ribosome-associated translation inhibitor RaiA